MALNYNDAIKIVEAAKAYLKNNISNSPLIDMADEVLANLADINVDLSNRIDFLSTFLKEILAAKIVINVYSQNDKKQKLTPGLLLEEITYRKKRFQANIMENQIAIAEDVAVQSAILLHQEKMQEKIAKTEEKRKIEEERSKIEEEKKKTEDASRQKQAKEYLDENKIKKLAEDVYTAFAEKNLDAVWFSIYELKSHFDERIQRLSDRSIKAHTALFVAYQAMISEFATREPKAVARVLSGLAVLKAGDKKALVTQVIKTIYAIGIEDVDVNKITDPDITIIRHLTHTKPIETVLPTIEKLFPTKEERNKLKQNKFI